MQPGVEPLRRVRRRDLAGQHVPHFVVIGLRVGLAVEIATFPAPIGPGPGDAVEDLLAAHFPAIPFVFRQISQRVLVGDAAPQPGRHAVFFDLLQAGRNAGLAEIFLRQHVAGDLAPARRDIDVFQTEHDGTVGIANLTGGLPEFDSGVRGLSFDSETAFDAHVCFTPAWSLSVAFFGPAVAKHSACRRPPSPCPTVKCHFELRGFPRFTTPHIWDDHYFATIC